MWRQRAPSPRELAAKQTEGVSVPLIPQETMMIHFLFLFSLYLVQNPHADFKQFLREKYDVHRHIVLIQEA